MCLVFYGSFVEPIQKYNINYKWVFAEMFAGWETAIDFHTCIYYSSIILQMENKHTSHRYKNEMGRSPPGIILKYGPVSQALFPSAHTYELFVWLDNANCLTGAPRSPFQITSIFMLHFARFFSHNFFVSHLIILQSFFSPVFFTFLKISIGCIPLSIQFYLFLTLFYTLQSTMFYPIWW